MSTHTTNKLKMLALSSSLLMLLFSCSDATDTTSIDVATSSASTGGEVETTVIDSALPRLSSIRNLDWRRSEEHTSELQSRRNLVCRLLLEKKNI